MVRRFLPETPKHFATVLHEDYVAQEERIESDEEFLKTIPYHRGLHF